MLPINDYIPTRRFPIATLTIILLNIIVFIFELVSGGSEALFNTLGIIPAQAVTAPLALHTWQHLVTSMFTHGGFAHIGFNMLYLWIFGNNVEDTMGSFRFLIFYLLTGAVAAAAHIIMNTGSQTPMIGASGAIAGVLGAYIILYPRAKVRTLIFWGVFARIADISALWVLGSWFVLQLFNGLAAIGNAYSGAVGGVAFWAHIGGFLAGLLFVRFFTQGVKRQTW